MDSHVFKRYYCSCILFWGSNDVLQRYVDSDTTRDKDSKRSTTWYVFTVGGTIVSWISKLQNVVSISTMEADYVDVMEASK